MSKKRKTLASVLTLISAVLTLVIDFLLKHNF